MDAQQVEILGRHLLIEHLVRAGLEVAIPLRDRGIDLIAYADVSSDHRFWARPIQMKASSKRSFSLHRKYEKFPELLLAYVWSLQERAEAMVFVLTYGEALKVMEAMGYTETESWTKGQYNTSKPSKRLLELLEAYRATPDRLYSLVVESPPSPGPFDC